MRRRISFLFAMTIWTWIVASMIAVLFFFVLRSDLSGEEWLGSPLLGMALISGFMAVFYSAARKKPIQPTMILFVWTVFLFLATTINMFSLAHYVLGGWEDFQVMPIMGTFQLILIAAGIHLSLKKELRSALFVLLTWTIVLFLLTTSTMFALACPLFGMWEDWQAYPILGTGLWTGLMVVATFLLRSRSISCLDALSSWAWSMCIGTSVSMLGVFFVLDRQEHGWPFYPIVGTLCFALLITVLRMSLQNH